MKKVLKNKFLWLIVGLCALVILIAGYYGSNYRISGLKIIQMGNIEILLDNPETHIFIDDKHSGFSFEDNQTLSFSKIKPGTHTIVVAKEGYWPWTKQIEIKEAETIELRPFVLPITKLKVAILKEEDQNYKEAEKSIGTFLISSMTRMANSYDRTTRIWIDGNKILAKKTSSQEEFLVFESIKDPIKNISFYKDRNDVILFASGNSIYAIELYKEGGQNFQPLLQGEDPIFVFKDIDNIFVRDSNLYFIINL